MVSKSFKVSIILGTINKATTGLNAVKKSIGVLSAAAAGFGAVSLKAASDFEETQSKFTTIFSSISDNAEKTAKNLAHNYGLSSKSSKELLSNTGDLLTGFNFTQKEALRLSTELNKLAIDLVSFTNFSGGAEGASIALTKALLGERESIKSLGISILETDVQQKLLEKGQKNLTGTALKQAKAQATLELAIEQSKNAIGDFARTNQSFANQTRILSARIQDIVVNIGSALLPVATKTVNVITNEIIPSITDWTSNTDNITNSTKILVKGLFIVIKAIQGVISIFDILATIIASTVAIFVDFGSNVINVFKQIGQAAVDFSSVMASALTFRFKEASNKFNDLKKTLESPFDFSLTQEALKGISETIEKNGQKFKDIKNLEQKVIEETTQKFIDGQTKRTESLIVQNELRTQNEIFTAERQKEIDKAVANAQKIHREEQLKAEKEKQEKFIQFSNNIANAWSSNIEEVLQGTSNMSEFVKDTFTDIKNHFIKQVSSMIAKWATLTALKGIGNILTGGLLGGVGKLFGFADGTNFAPGGMAMVGERGPELVNLPRGSQVIPTDRTRQVLAGSNGMTINVMVSGNTIMGDRGINKFSTMVSKDILKKVRRERNI